MSTDELNSISALVESILNPKNTTRLLAVTAEFLHGAAGVDGDPLAGLMKFALDFCRDVCTLEPVFQIVDNRAYLFRGPKYSIKMENFTASEILFLRERVITKIKTDEIDDEFGYTDQYWSPAIKYDLSASSRQTLAVFFFIGLLANLDSVVLDGEDSENRGVLLRNNNYKLLVCEKLLGLVESTEFVRATSVGEIGVPADVAGIIKAAKTRAASRISETLKDSLLFE